MTQADIGGDGKWFCNIELAAKNIESEGYAKFIDRMNNAYSSWSYENPDATMDDKTDYLIRGGLEGLGKKAECLSVYHNVDPDDVAMLSPEIREVLEQYPDKLNEVAPTLVKYTTVPEFGSIALLILIISIVGVMISTRKLNVIE